MTALYILGPYIESAPVVQLTQLTHSKRVVATEANKVSQNT